MQFHVSDTSSAAEIGYTLTVYFILVLFAIIIAVDVYFAFIDEFDNNTISNVLRDWAHSRFFVLTWTWGVLAGHLFLPRAGGDGLLGNPWSILTLLALTLALLLVGLFVHKIEFGARWQIALLLVGTAAGHLLWPQRLAQVMS